MSKHKHKPSPEPKKIIRKARPPITQEQREAIAADRELGMTYWQLVRKHDISFIHTQRICREEGV